MIKGENTILRALEPHDVDVLLDWENDTRLWYLSNTLIPFSRFDLERYVLSADKDIFIHKQLRLMIDLLQDGEAITIGALDLFDFDPYHKRAGLGILIDPDYRQKGYATEAIKLILNYCFKTLQLHQLYCNISASNEVSLKLFQSQGFTISGTKSEWMLRDGNWEDEHILQYIKR